ncbi:MAG: hypothetical protein JWR25_808 [Noviherbaspirillum sp.]|nr:hypothetical protein [Noviherbaspirillum sp.]
MRPDFSQTVLTLDLDDTLYKEADYYRSGLRQVCAEVESLYGKSVVDDLARLEKEGERDLFEAICRLMDVPVTVKESLLWIYRVHAPSISLGDSVRALLSDFEKRFAAVVILTDGRSVSQRQKLKALGLAHLPAYISEEYGAMKPDPLRFKQIMRDFPAERYIYVADNPLKDFIAPNVLGWATIGIKGDHRNIHSQACDGLSVDQVPQKWISSLNELLESLC